VEKVPKPTGVLAPEDAHLMSRGNELKFKVRAYHDSSETRAERTVSCPHSRGDTNL
jgi:hypothetical protein